MKSIVHIVFCKSCKLPIEKEEEKEKQQHLFCKEAFFEFAISDPQAIISSLKDVWREITRNHYVAPFIKCQMKDCFGLLPLKYFSWEDEDEGLLSRFSFSLYRLDNVIKYTNNEYQFPKHKELDMLRICKNHKYLFIYFQIVTAIDFLRGNESVQIKTSYWRRIDDLLYKHPNNERVYIDHARIILMLPYYKEQEESIVEKLVPIDEKYTKISSGQFFMKQTRGPKFPELYKSDLRNGRDDYRHFGHFLVGFLDESIINFEHYRFNPIRKITKFVKISELSEQSKKSIENFWKFAHNFEHEIKIDWARVKYIVHIAYIQYERFFDDSAGYESNNYCPDYFIKEYRLFNVLGDESKNYDFGLSEVYRGY